MEDWSAVASATAGFCRHVIDAVASAAAIIKPQAAFFEQLGVAGMQGLADIIRYCGAQGLPVLLDGKRGDIGSTAAGYADAYLGKESPWGCDALTVNPYLGDDTLQPFIQLANQRAAGVFILVKTSNPGSGFIQDLEVDHRPIYQRVAETVQREAAASRGSGRYGNVGAVVGATYPRQLAELRQLMPNAWLLIPGFGAQGGTAQDVQAGYHADGLGAIVNSSRGIIFAYELEAYRHLDWRGHSPAARDMAAELPRPT